MAFRLSLRYKGQEITATETDTDDPIVALNRCKQFQGEVLPILRENMPQFKRVTDSDIERRVDRIELQLSFSLNGRHDVFGDGGD